MDLWEQGFLARKDFVSLNGFGFGSHHSDLELVDIIETGVRSSVGVFGWECELLLRFDGGPMCFINWSLEVIRVSVEIRRAAWTGGMG